MAYQIPIVIMGGADKPEKQKRIRKWHKRNNKNTITGYKLARLRLNGKSLGQNLVERLKESGYFNEIYIVGPKRIYEKEVDLNMCHIINTDFSIGENIINSLEYIVNNHGRDIQFAIMFGDHLPEVSEIKQLMHELKPKLNLDFIYELVERPQDIGQSSYKLGYKFINRNHEKKKYLPGHIAIIKPNNLKTKLAGELCTLFYAKRGKPVTEKIAYALMNKNKLKPYKKDVLEALPYTFHGLMKFLFGYLSIRDAERKLSNVIIKRSHRKQSNDRHIYIHTTNIFSFAKDFDAWEEFYEYKAKIAQKTP